MTKSMVASVTREEIAELVHYQTLDTNHIEKGTAEQRNLSEHTQPNFI
jgi:hypothetical protein